MGWISTKLMTSTKSENLVFWNWWFWWWRYTKSWQKHVYFHVLFLLSMSILSKFLHTEQKLLGLYFKFFFRMTSTLSGLEVQKKNERDWDFQLRGWRCCFFENQVHYFLSISSVIYISVENSAKIVKMYFLSVESDRIFIWPSATLSWLIFSH